MELKNFQQAVLDRLSLYLKVLKDKHSNALNLVQFFQKEGKEIQWDSEDLNFCNRAWQELNKQNLIPLISRKVLDKWEAIYVPTNQPMTKASYKSRVNGMGRPVPNICLKVPTGGGKTLLGVSSVERINTAFFERNTGFVLWVVPSDSIYKQTLKSFMDRESLNRQILDRASAGAGRVKILQWRGKDKKRDRFSLSDTQDSLCVLLLMLPSASGRSKDVLTMFRGAGGFSSFFPAVDDYHANQELLKAIPNLDTYDFSHSSPLGGLNTISLKHSLGNVLKMQNPLIVIDEGHRAYTEKAKNTLMDLNPRFILELSATPNKKTHESNVLVSVSGVELKKEEMIKLPINIFSLTSQDWKKALAKGYETLQSLSQSAITLQKKEKRYVRPIMLIRVERTGKDQRDKKFIHSEDVREYLIKNFNVDPLEIKVKSAEKDELKNEDLLSEYSLTRYIITKEALKEGWDCPFAYVLTILSKTKAPVAIEQMIGRVLRQPETRKTGIEPLNQSYVVCMDTGTAGAVEGIRKGLENEGLDGLGGDIKTSGAHQAGVQEVTIRRRKKFRSLKIFLPKVLYREGEKLREFSYEKDLLFYIDWSKLRLSRGFAMGDRAPDISHTTVDIKQHGELLSSMSGNKQDNMPLNFDIDFGFMCQRLSDIMPNPWDISVTVDKALKVLTKKYGKKQVYLNRFYILDCLRDNLQNQISQKQDGLSLTEKLFREKIKKHEIIFKLVSAGDPSLNWEMAKTLNLSIAESQKKFRTQYDNDVQLSLFEQVYQKDFNDLETKVAWYLDEDSAIKWWHRIIEKQDWNLQGWQKNKIYPDFLVCVESSQNGTASFRVLETKGKHLIGNADTQYKEKLFKLFTEYSKKSVPAGTIEIQDHIMTFDLILQDKWKQSLNQIFKLTKHSP